MNRKRTQIDSKMIELVIDDIIIDGKVFATIDKDLKMMEFFLNLPSLQTMHNPIQMQHIRNQQQQDQDLLNIIMTHPILHHTTDVSGRLKKKHPYLMEVGPRSVEPKYDNDTSYAIS